MSAIRVMGAKDGKNAEGEVKTQMAYLTDRN